MITDRGNDKREFVPIPAFAAVLVLAVFITPALRFLAPK